MALADRTAGRRARDARERGTLLIDAMLALVLFSAALASWAALTNQKMRTIGEADRRFVATNAAQSAIAELRERVRAPGPFAVPGGAGLTGELRVMSRPDGLQEIVAEVHWREPGSRGALESVVISSAGRP